MKGPRTIISLLLAFLTAAAASCSGNTAPPSVPEAPVTASESFTAAETSDTQASEEAPDDLPEETQVSETEQSDTESPESGDSTSDTTDETSETLTEEPPPEETTALTTSEETEETQPEPDAELPEIALTTTSTPAAAPRTAASVKSTAADSKTSEVSTPQINEVSSPGKNVFKSSSAVLDWTNCSKGYISVDYKGKTRLKMLLKKGTSQFDFDIYPAKGPQYFTLAQGSGTYTAEIYEMLDNGKFVKLISDSFTAKITDEIKMFTYRNQYVSFDAKSKCVKKASEICAGCKTDIEKIAAVFKYVTDNVTYDKALAASVTSGYIPDPDSVLAKKKGICFDYASLTAAMLRSQGVPTRLVVGYASPNIYHAWNEVYTTEKGWIAAEIVLEGKGFRRIDTTFYASASNKKSFAEYIAKSGSYSDVYVY